MKKILTSVLALTAALFLSSCFESKTEITINKDGSGIITEEITMGEQMLSMMEMAASQGGVNQNFLADIQDEAKLKAKAAQYGEGVTFLKVEEIKMDDGGKGARVTYEFSDINKVSLGLTNGLSILTSIKPGEKSASDEVAPMAKATFAYTDGKLAINVPQTDHDKTAEESEGNAQDFDPQDPQMTMMLELMQGMNMHAKVILTGGIAETNATHHAEDTITLFELNFDEVMKNSEGLNSLSGLNTKKPGDIAKTLGSIKGTKTETQKSITATFK